MGAQGIALIIALVNHFLFALYLLLRWYFISRGTVGLSAEERRHLE